MPSYFLTARYPVWLLGDDCFESVMKPQPSHEEQSHVFYETDLQVVSEKLLELLRGGEPDFDPFTYNPNRTIAELLERAGSGEKVSLGTPTIFEIVNGADLDLRQRVLYRADLELVASVGSCEGDPGILEAANLPHDRRSIFLSGDYKRARQWEPHIRDELGLGEKVGQQQLSPEEPAETDSEVSPATKSPREEELPKDTRMPSNPVTCVYVAGIIRKRSDVVARTLKAHQYTVVKKAHKNYCDAEQAAVLWPKWKKHWQELQENE